MRRQILWSALAVAALTLMAGLVAGATIQRQLVQESEAELTAIYENAPLIMILVDEDRSVLKSNRAAIEEADRQQVEIIGQIGEIGRASWRGIW